MTTAEKAVARAPMGRQLRAVYGFLSDGGWWTFAHIQSGVLYSDYVRISEAGISARIRDLRKPRYGGHVIERRATAQKGVYAYRLVTGEQAPKREETPVVSHDNRGFRTCLFLDPTP
jgi:hypothetical protein